MWDGLDLLGKLMMTSSMTMMGSTSSFNMNHDSQSQSHCTKDKIQIIDSIDNEILEKEEEQGDDEKTVRVKITMQQLLQQMRH